MADFNFQQSAPTIQELLNSIPGKAEQVDVEQLQSDVETLRALYEALQQSAPVIIQPSDTWPVASPEEGVIYRVIDRTNTPPQYYSDYMWNGSTMVQMAQYNNAIDGVPTPGSDNLVKSGGVDLRITEKGAYIYRIDTFDGGTLVTGSTSSYMRWGDKTASSGNVPYVEYTNNTDKIVYVALCNIADIGQPLTFKNITILDPNNNILNEKCINSFDRSPRQSDPLIVGVTVPIGCKVIANASKLYYGVHFVSDYSQRPLDYTKNPFCNKAIMELYITGYTITENTSVLLHNHFVGNQEWGLYIFEGTNIVIGQGYTEEPNSYDVIKLSNSNITVYAVINWKAIADGGEVVGTLNNVPCTNLYYSPIINNYIKNNDNAFKNLNFAQNYEITAYKATYVGWQNNVSTQLVKNSLLGHDFYVTKITIGNNTSVNTLAVDFSSFVHNSLPGDYADIDWYFYSPVSSNRLRLVIYNSRNQSIKFITDYGLANDQYIKINSGLNIIKLKIQIISTGYDSAEGGSQFYFKDTNFANTESYSLANVYCTNSQIFPRVIKNNVDIYAIGDSLTVGYVWEDKLKRLLATKVSDIYNYGIGGEGVGTIFGRLNSIQMKLASAITIPESGDVTVTLKNDYGSWLLPLLQSGNSHTVVIGGIRGVLSTTTEAASLSATYKFTRSEIGNAVSIAIDEPILFTPSMKYGGIPSDSYQIIWVGQNGGYSANTETARYQPNPITENDANNLVEMIKCHISATNPLKYLVLSAPKNTTETLESIMSKAFGGSFINVRKQMVDNGIRIALEKGYLSGSYPTAQDEQDIANGIVPTSLRADNVHFNTAGYYTLAEIIKCWIDNLWNL